MEVGAVAPLTRHHLTTFQRSEDFGVVMAFVAAVTELALQTVGAAVLVNTDGLVEVPVWTWLL
jgi:hypothetical protein